MLHLSSRILATRLSSTTITRCVFAPSSSIVARTFSEAASCEPAQRLRDVLAEYKREHFSREIPTRFKKEVLSPYVGKNNNNEIDVEQLNLLLTNIGHPQDCLSADEQTELLQAAGSTNRCITVQKMMELID